MSALRPAVAAAALALAACQGRQPAEKSDEISVITAPSANQPGKHSRQKLDEEASSHRDDAQKPAEVLQTIGINKGDVVADVGCGAGYFAFRFAEAVGEEGLVYCIDSDPNAVDYVKERLVETGVDNIQLVLSARGDTLLEPGTADLAFLCDVHFFNQPTQAIGEQYLAEFTDFYNSVHGIIKPGGRLVIIESTAEASNARGVDAEGIIGQVSPFGFEVTEQHFIPERPQYFIIFRKVEPLGGRPEPAVVQALLEQMYPALRRSAAPQAPIAEGGHCHPTPTTRREKPLEPGTGVTLQGLISGLDPPKMTDPINLLVDVAKGDSAVPGSVYSVVCGAEPAFELEVPAELGQVQLRAFLDLTGDGPSPDDPSGQIDLLVGSEPLSVGEIELRTAP